MPLLTASKFEDGKWAPGPATEAFLERSVGAQAPADTLAKRKALQRLARAALSDFRKRR